MSYTLNGLADDIKTRSTDTLGIGRNQHEESDDRQSGNGFRKTKNCLVISVVITVLLLIVCIVLSVSLAIQVRKLKQQSSKEPSTPSDVGTTDKVYCYSPECLQLAADFARNMNTSFDPCEDVFQHTCGTWIKYHPIPPSRNMYDTFMLLEDKNYEKMRQLLEEVDQLPYGSAVRKAKSYFKTCLNEGEVEKTANQTLLLFIAKYGSWALDNQTWNSSAWSWSKTLTALNRDSNTPPLFGIYLDINPRNSSRYLLAVSSRLDLAVT